jgi:hypothetical protein
MIAILVQGAECPELVPVLGAAPPIGAREVPDLVPPARAAGRSAPVADDALSSGSPAQGAVPQGVPIPVPPAG